MAKNIMEPLVLRELSRCRETLRNEGRCLCSLCEADIAALALSSLPPRYCTTHFEENLSQDHFREPVRRKLRAAAAKVKQNPKHPPGEALVLDAPLRLINFTFEEGFALLEDFFTRRDKLCKCEQCRRDMLAFALNRYPSRYGVEHAGITKLPEHHRYQMKQELVSFMQFASQVVTTLPGH